MYAAPLVVAMVFSRAVPIVRACCLLVSTVAEVTPESAGDPGGGGGEDRHEDQAHAEAHQDQTGQQPARVVGVDREAGEEQHPGRREERSGTISTRGATRRSSRAEIWRRTDDLIAAVMGRKARLAPDGRSTPGTTWQVVGHEQENAEHADDGEGHRQEAARARAVLDDVEREQRARSAVCQYTNAVSSTIPPARRASTSGSVQPRASASLTP